MKSSRKSTNTLIYGSNGVKYDATSKATAMVDFLEYQVEPNDYEDVFLDHYTIRQVRQGVEAFCNTEFKTCIKEVTGNELRTIIKRLKHKKSTGHDGVTNSMINQLRVTTSTTSMQFIIVNLSCSTFQYIRRKSR